MVSTRQAPVKPAAGSSVSSTRPGGEIRLGSGKVQLPASDGCAESEAPSVESRTELSDAPPSDGDKGWDASAWVDEALEEQLEPASRTDRSPKRGRMGPALLVTEAGRVYGRTAFAQANSS
jgi:hypothetical protein